MRSLSLFTLFNNNKYLIELHSFRQFHHTMRAYREWCLFTLYLFCSVSGNLVNSSLFDERRKKNYAHDPTHNSDLHHWKKAHQPIKMVHNSSHHRLFDLEDKWIFRLFYDKPVFLLFPIVLYFFISESFQFTHYSKYSTSGNRFVCWSSLLLLLGINFFSHLSFDASSCDSLVQHIAHKHHIDTPFQSLYRTDVLFKWNNSF